MGTLILPIATVLLSILLLFLFFLKKRINNSETRIYSKMLLVNFAYSVLAIIIFLYSKTIGNELIISILQKCYMILMLLMILLIEMYNINILKIGNKNKKIIRLFTNITAVIFILGIVVSPIKVINDLKFPIR